MQDSPDPESAVSTPHTLIRHINTQTFLQISIRHGLWSLQSPGSCPAGPQRYVCPARGEVPGQGEKTLIIIMVLRQQRNAAVVLRAASSIFSQTVLQ